MYKCENFWRSQRIWGKIEEQKPIFMEPRNKDALKQAMRQYYGNINQQKGAIFMAVLRGKVSEGLDFADMYGRGVIIGKSIAINVAQSELSTKDLLTFFLGNSNIFFDYL